MPLFQTTASVRAAQSAAEASRRHLEEKENSKRPPLYFGNGTPSQSFELKTPSRQCSRTPPPSRVASTATTPGNRHQSCRGVPSSSRCASASSTGARDGPKRPPLKASRNRSPTTVPPLKKGHAEERTPAVNVEENRLELLGEAASAFMNAANLCTPPCPGAASDTARVNLEGSAEAALDDDQEVRLSMANGDCIILSRGQSPRRPSRHEELLRQNVSVDADVSTAPGGDTRPPSSGGGGWGLATLIRASCSRVLKSIGKRLSSREHTPDVACLDAASAVAADASVALADASAVLVSGPAEPIGDASVAVRLSFQQEEAADGRVDALFAPHANNAVETAADGEQTTPFDVASDDGLDALSPVDEEQQGPSVEADHTIADQGASPPIEEKFNPKRFFDPYISPIPEQPTPWVTFPLPPLDAIERLSAAVPSPPRPSAVQQIVATLVARSPERPESPLCPNDSALSFVANDDVLGGAVEREESCESNALCVGPIEETHYPFSPPMPMRPSVVAAASLADRLEVIRRSMESRLSDSEDLELLNRFARVAGSVELHRAQMLQTSYVAESPDESVQEHRASRQLAAEGSMLRVRGQKNLTPLRVPDLRGRSKTQPKPSPQSIIDARGRVTETIEAWSVTPAGVDEQKQPVENEEPTLAERVAQRHAARIPVNYHLWETIVDQDLRAPLPRCSGSKRHHRSRAAKLRDHGTQTPPPASPARRGHRR